MSPRWDTPQGTPTRRDAAMIAEVLDALRTQLLAPDASDVPHTSDVEELLSAAMAELHRVRPFDRHEGGVAPVLGSGVVQEILRRRHEARPQTPPPTADGVPSSVDERR